MGWIEERIEAEHRKHYPAMWRKKYKPNLNWALIAEKKILSELKEKFYRVKEWIPNADSWQDKEGKLRDFNLDTWDLAEKIYGDVIKMLEETTVNNTCTNSEEVKNG